MEDLNVPIFAQAKIEYTNQLVDVLYPHMYDGVKSIYDESKVIYAKKTSTPILFLFRELLEKVPIWNNEIIERECSRIMNNSKCDWIDDLITAVFISHTKILTSIGPNNTFNKINVTIPKTTSFIHKSYINLARELWKNPYLFNENVPGHEYQRNCKEIENIIKQCVEGTIRQLLPIKEILREHLDTYDDSSKATSKSDIKQKLKEELSKLRNSNIQSNISDNLSNNEESEDEADINIKDKGQEDNHNFNIVVEEDPVDKGSEINHDLNINSDVNENTGQLNNKINEEYPVVLESEISLPPKEIFSSDDDPTEEQIKKQVDDIVVNDITIPVEDNGGISSEVLLDNKINDSPVVEPKYDNINIVSGEDEKKDIKLSDMMKHMKEPVEVSVVKNTETGDTENKEKIDNIDNSIIDGGDSFGFNTIFGKSEPKPESSPELKSTSGESTEKVTSLSDISGSDKKEDTKEIISTPEIISEVQPKTMEVSSSVETTSDNSKGVISINENKDLINPLDEKSNKEKQVIEMGKEDIDETSSLANFFNDMKQVVEDKGIKVEQSNKFSLFEDASEVG